jgi:hypothetical protein
MSAPRPIRLRERPIVEKNSSTAVRIFNSTAPLACLLAGALSEGRPTSVILGITAGWALLLGMIWMGVYGSWLMSYVELGTDGIIIRNLLRRHSIRYSDIRFARSVRRSYNRLACFDLCGYLGGFDRNDLCVYLVDGPKVYCLAFSGRINDAHAKEIERVIEAIISTRDQALRTSFVQTKESS